jgi:hypothetical protein
MLDIFSNAYLQSISLPIEIPVLAVMISCVTMTIFAITLWITWKTTKENTRATYSQLLRSFHEDLTKRLEKNAILQTTEDCERYANDYLNTLDEIAYLTLNDKIPTEIGTYLRRFFGYGIIIIDWYDKMVSADFGKIAKSNWPNHFEFCKKFNIQKNPDDKLPKIMQDFNKK